MIPTEHPTPLQLREAATSQDPISGEWLRRAADALEATADLAEEYLVELFELRRSIRLAAPRLAAEITAAATAARREPWGDLVHPHIFAELRGGRRPVDRRGVSEGEANRSFEKIRAEAEVVRALETMTTEEIADTLNRGDLPPMVTLYGKPAPGVYKVNEKGLVFEGAPVVEGVLTTGEVAGASAVSTRAIPPGGRTAADVNRERRARGELGTKRQRRARKGR